MSQAGIGSILNFQELSWGWAVGLAHVIRRISCLTEEEPFQSRSQLWKWIFLRSSEIRDIKNKKFQLTFHLFQICTKCVRCKSCGSTTPGKGWDAQWSHDFSLCHDCAKLFAKGNSEKLAQSTFRGCSQRLGGEVDTAVEGPFLSRMPFRHIS